LSLPTLRLIDGRLAARGDRGSGTIAPVDGFVAVTDPGWYERLARDPGPRDANFWWP
jgi:hypothetical protein